MTEPRDLQRERLTTAAAADGEPEGIPDLDVPGATRMPCAAA